jgi:Zn finger protein HypA/HybF involved in hydrogenase expression
VGEGIVSTSTHGAKLMGRTEAKMTEVETYKGDAYCVKCKEKRDFEGTVKISDSGRRMAQGICPVCGTKVNRILGKKPE